MAESGNVIAFEPRPPPRKVHAVEQHLNSNTTISWTLFDARGDVSHVIVWSIQSLPPDFDSVLMYEAWDLWKQFYGNRVGIEG